MSVLIKNGIIGTAACSFRGDLLIEGEKIAAVGESIHCAGAEIIDAAGRYVVPGGVDPHTHVMLHVGKNKVSDGFEAATKAALCGGTTTIAEHPAFAADGAPLAAAPDDTLKEAEAGSWCDFGVHLVFQRWDAAISEELPDAVANGFATGKVYTTYSGRLCDEDILPLMKRMKECGGLLFYHCENNAVAAGLQADFSGRRTDSGRVLAAEPPRLLRGGGHQQGAGACEGGGCSGLHRPPLHKGGAQSHSRSA